MDFPEGFSCSPHFLGSEYTFSLCFQGYFLHTKVSWGWVVKFHFPGGKSEPSLVLRDTVFYAFRFELYCVTRYFTDFHINSAQNRNSQPCLVVTKTWNRTVAERSVPFRLLKYGMSYAELVSYSLALATRSRCVSHRLVFRN